MGKLLLVWRLTTKDLRHRPAEAVLLLLAIATAATALTLGMALHGATNNPYAATRAATNGPDVVATEVPGGPGNPGPEDAAALTRLDHASGVVAHSGPFPVTWALLRARGLTAGAEIEGRSSAPSAVDQPKLTSGSWLRPGGVVIEGGFARALGLGIGDQITLGRVSFRVVGIAVTAAIPNYSGVCFLGCDMPGNLGNYNPGLVWLTQTDAERVAALSAEPVAYFADLELSDPAQANDFANAYDANTSPRAPFLLSWQSIRNEDATTISNDQLVLLTGSWLLGLLALASVAVLVGGRMAAQTRRVGLVKAVGGTPGLVATVFLFEHVLLGHRPGRCDGAGSGSHRDVRAGHSRGAHKHRQRARGRGADTTAQSVGGRVLGTPAGAVAAGCAPGSPQAAPARAQCAQRRDHRERDRRRACRPCHRRQPWVPRSEQPAEPSARPGDVGHFGNAHRPGHGQRDLDRLGDGS
jgi:putative ABC transport system permease protein